MDIAEEVGCNPFKVLMMIAAADWEGLGYESATITKHGKDDVTWEEDRITLDARGNAAKEVCKYLFPQKRAVEVSNPTGETFVVSVIDYQNKEPK